MAGTRTAPDVTLTPQYINLSVAWIDYTGNIRTDTYQIDVTNGTPANIEAFLDDLQAGSNASIWRVERSEVFNSVPDNNNANEEVWEDVQDNVVIQYKDPANNSNRVYIPSPINAMFTEGTELINIANATYSAIVVSFATLLAATFNAVGGRFTKRKRIGRQVRH